MCRGLDRLTFGELVLRARERRSKARPMYHTERGGMKIADSVLDLMRRNTARASAPLPIAGGAAVVAKLRHATPAAA